MVYHYKHIEKVADHYLPRKVVMGVTESRD